MFELACAEWSGGGILKGFNLHTLVLLGNGGVLNLWVALAGARGVESVDLRCREQAAAVGPESLSGDSPPFWRSERNEHLRAARTTVEAINCVQVYAVSRAECFCFSLFVAVVLLVQCIADILVGYGLLIMM